MGYYLYGSYDTALTLYRRAAGTARTRAPCGRSRQIAVPRVVEAFEVLCAMGEHAYDGLLACQMLVRHRLSRADEYLGAARPGPPVDRDEHANGAHSGPGDESVRRQAQPERLRLLRTHAAAAGRWQGWVGAGRVGWGHSPGA